ncbi:MAG: UPF0182 family protein, partial [Deltaproteobacteria bacterium]
MAKKNRLILVIISATLIFSLVSSLLYFYTDWLFFVETGFTSVFITTLTARIGVGLLFGLLMLVIVLVNLFIANRFPVSHTGVFIPGAGYRIGSEDTARLSIPLSLLAGFVLAFLAGKWGAVQWEDVLLYSNRLPVGTMDPVNGKDIGFYLFTLPFLESLSDFAGFALPVIMIAVVLLYFLRGAITLSEMGITVDAKARKHLAVLVGICSLAVAAGFYLDGFRLLLSGSSAFHGAGYADVHARLPTYRLLTFLTPVAGWMLAAGLWKGGLRAALMPVALLFVVYIGGVKLYPSLLQKFKVAPNELALETPYIESNIKFTRLGF